MLARRPIPIVTFRFLFHLPYLRLRRQDLQSLRQRLWASVRRPLCVWLRARLTAALLYFLGPTASHLICRLPHLQRPPLRTSLLHRCPLRQALVRLHRFLVHNQEFSRLHRRTLNPTRIRAQALRYVTSRRTCLRRAVHHVRRLHVARVLQARRLVAAVVFNQRRQQTQATQAVRAETQQATRLSQTLAATRCRSRSGWMHMAGVTVSALRNRRRRCVDVLGVKPRRQLPQRRRARHVGAPI